jgi:hypothetical protein
MAKAKPAANAKIRVGEDVTDEARAAADDV